MFFWKDQGVRHGFNCGWKIYNWFPFYFKTPYFSIHKYFPIFISIGSFEDYDHKDKFEKFMWFINRKLQQI